MKWDILNNAIEIYTFNNIFFYAIFLKKMAEHAGLKIIF